MTRTIWITRTLPAAQDSASAWAQVGFVPIVEPLLEVRPTEHEVLPPETYVIFTSKNGVDHYKDRGHRAICVGDATAEHARRAGYKDVISVDGTSADVTRWVLKHLPKDQPIAHISGQHVRGIITEDLRAAGYPASRQIVYRSHKISRWPDGPVEWVALYSPLAAEAFAEAAAGRDTSRIAVVAISEATAQPLDNLILRSLNIAARPREDAMIASAMRVSP